MSFDMLSKMYFYSVVRKNFLSICMTFWNLQQIIRLQMQNGMGRIYFHSCWRCSGSDVKAESRHEGVVMMAPHPASVALLYVLLHKVPSVWPCTHQPTNTTAYYTGSLLKALGYRLVFKIPALPPSYDCWVLQPFNSQLLSCILSQL